MRDLLKSEQLVEFMQRNQHLKLEVFMRRNHHPYVSSTYINGFVKDQPLRQMGEEEVLDQFKKFNQTFGRSSLDHNSKKVVTSNSSIQGEWNSDTFDRNPKHEMEFIHQIPGQPLPEPVQREIPLHKKNPHYLRSFTRKNFKVFKYTHYTKMHTA